MASTWQLLEVSIWEQNKLDVQITTVESSKALSSGRFCLGECCFSWNSVIPNFDNLGFATLHLPLFGVWDCLNTLLATRQRKIKASNVRNCSGRLRRKHLGHLESFKRQYMPCIVCTKTTTCRDHLTLRSFPFYLGRVRGMLVRCRTLRRVEIGINKIQRRKIGMAIKCSVTF